MCCPRLSLAYTFIVTLYVAVFAYVLKGWANSPTSLTILMISMASFTTPSTEEGSVLTSAGHVMGLDGLVCITLIGASHCKGFDCVGSLWYRSVPDFLRFNEVNHLLEWHLLI